MYEITYENKPKPNTDAKCTVLSSEQSREEAKGLLDEVSKNDSDASLLSMVTTLGLLKMHGEKRRIDPEVAYKMLVEYRDQLKTEAQTA